MSNKLNTYSFLPWVRRGIANQIQDADGTSDKLRASFDIDLDIVGSGIDENKISPVSKTISLYGPCDIIGIDSKAIIKTEPHNWVTNFEPNYMPCIDFYDEDFPWRYSPVLPDDNGRLQPWLALVVLEEGLFNDGRNMTNHPLPYIQLKEGIEAKDVFQPSDQLWAWAHVHVNRDLIKDDNILPTYPDTLPIERVFAEPNSDEYNFGDIINEFENALNENPDLAYSRVVCPLKLKENTAYHAFLIPAFESGRLAGLGLKVEEIFFADGSELKPFTLAWANDNENPAINRTEANKFPVYHRWYFRTGNVGDFEYLVRLLEPKPVDNRVGRRDMDVTQPGSNIDGISDLPEEGSEVPQLGGILRLGGALRIPVDSMEKKDREEYQKYENWDQPYPRKFQKQLAAFINLSDDYSENIVKKAHNNENLPDKIVITAAEDDPDPLITAPLYGRWHALTKRLLKTGDGIPNDNWVHKLNLDPRHRATAGFGTKVVQTNQENYMESAWQQVGDVLEANKRIRQAQFAQFASKRWFNKYLKPIQKSNEGSFLWLTQPVQTRVLSRGLTLEGKEEMLTAHHQVKISKVPAVAFSSSIRKFTRPGCRLVKTLDFNEKTNSITRLVDRINKGEVNPSPPKKVPEGILTIEDFVNACKPHGVPGFLLKWIEKYSWFKYLIIGIAVIILLLLAIFAGPNLRTLTPGVGSISGFGMLIVIFLIFLFRKIISWEKQINKANTLKEENQTSKGVDNLPKKPDFRLTVAGESKVFNSGASDSEEGKRFKQALKDVGELIQVNIKAGEVPDLPQLYLDRIASATLSTLNPEESIPNYILKTQVTIPDRLRREKTRETFKEAMAYPEFDTPMYKPLIDISADLFLPNLNFISQNSISLLETNQAFIEAYMVGLNHEFARELLWREYPTDQRGSYFRQFWDVSDFMYEPEQIQKFITNARSKLPEDATEEEIDKQVREEIKESLKDIPKIHLWSKYSKLGEHDHREKYKKERLLEISDERLGDEGNNQEAVLVIRGELLKKYPNAVIYAHRAKWKPKEGTEDQPDKGQEREFVFIPPDEEENPPRDTIKTPLYEAKVDPDIYFFGFDLTVKVAQGLTEGEPENLEDRAGWFFVIKERPGEPRFGLDVGTADEIEVWNDLAWGNIIPQDNDDNFLQITSLTQTINVGTDPLEEDDNEKIEQREEDIQIIWNKDMNSAELAYILYQAPVMVAVHAAEMLPKKRS